jgi:uncharacterized protein
MIIVNWHHGCYDGFGSMWSAKRALDVMGHPDFANAEYVASSYGNDRTDYQDKLLVYVDYCPKLGVIEELAKNNLVLVLDHHKTAKAELDGIPKIDANFEEYHTRFIQGHRGAYALFDMNRSGAGITYDYFNQGSEKRPNMIKFIEDRDLWAFRFGDKTKAFHAYLLSQPFDYNEWTKIFEQAESHEGLERIINKGMAVLEYGNQLVKNIVDTATVHEAGNTKYAFFNTTSHWAEVGEYAVHTLGVDYSVSLTFDSKKNQIRGSVRGKKGKDCTKIAGFFQGGGHAGAAGFQVPISESPMTIKNRIDTYFENGGE